MKVRYFCANCGAEVGLREQICPNCQRGFLSVKCPRCGFNGKADLFLAGCPSCGYMHASEPETKSAGSMDRSHQEPAHRGLPSRIYRLAGIALIALIAVFLAILLF